MAAPAQCVIRRRCPVRHRIRDERRGCYFYDPFNCVVSFKVLRVLELGEVVMGINRCAEQKIAHEIIQCGKVGVLCDVLSHFYLGVGTGWNIATTVSCYRLL